MFKSIYGRILIMHTFIFIIFITWNLIMANDLPVTNEQFEIKFKDSGEGITSIKYTKDETHLRKYRDPNEYFHRLSVEADPSKLTKTEFLHPGKVLGEIKIRARVSDKSGWDGIVLDDSRLERSESNTIQRLIQRGYLSDRSTLADKAALQLSRQFELHDNHILWTMEFENISEKTLEIGDIALPIVFNNHFVHNMLTTYVQRVFPQSFIGGPASFLLAIRCNGEGPYLVITPQEGTQIEFFEQLMDRHVGEWSGTYVYYIHSAARGPEVQPGTWRQPHTGISLTPSGTEGSKVLYSFKIQWAEDIEAVRDILYREGLFDVQVAGSMTVPRGESVMFSLHTKNTIDSISSEFPEQTRLEYCGEKEKDRHVYRVSFDHLGENKLIVNYNGKNAMPLEFFCCQSIETLIKKRAEFVTRNQCRDKSKWYYGLFHLWDMDKKESLTPENKGKYPSYFVNGGDDPGPANGVFLSQKNVVWPDKEQIRALDRYLNNFVWGGIQRTDKEDPYPGAIYGSGGKEGWIYQRELNLKDISRLWRSYDYTHYFYMYYNMYLISRKNEIFTELTAMDYLYRAWLTAMAFYNTTRIFPDGQWGEDKYIYWAYFVSHHHERFLPEIIDALIREGEREKAEELRNEWEKKVKYALYDTPIAFGTEMAWGDPSVFSGCHAMGKYAINHPMKPDTNLWQNNNSGKWYSHPSVKPEHGLEYLHKANQANVACRGWLTPTYYFYGSSGCNTGWSYYCLSYHPTIGGWALLDYTLRYSDDPMKLMDLAYASLTAPWALMNAGTPESDYGFWYSGKENDGSCGWAYEASKSNIPWMYGGRRTDRRLPRGIWPLDGEIGHGTAAQIYSAATIVAEHPVFGLIAYGGEVSHDSSSALKIWSKDGVRQRLHYLDKKNRFHLSLKSDGFVKDEPVIIKKDLSAIHFVLENRFGNAHNTRLTLEGLPEGTYVLIIDDKKIKKNTKQGKLAFDLPLNKSTLTAVQIKKI